MDQEWINIFQEMAEELGRGDTWMIERDDTIVADKLEPHWKQYIRSTFARFKCSLCKKTWPSKRVLVVFHMQLSIREHRGTVKVRCYKQKCRRCNDAPFEEPQIQKENVDLLLEKLIEKIRIKCYKENIGELGKDFHFDGRVDGPHEVAHCEACRQGICVKSK